MRVGQLFVLLLNFVDLKVFEIKMFHIRCDGLQLDFPYAFFKLRLQKIDPIQCSAFDY